MARKKVCNLDCFHCSHPDCINDDPCAKTIGIDDTNLYPPKTPDAKTARKRQREQENRAIYAARQKVIRARRKAAGLSQKAVAESLGVSTSAIYLWETGGAPAKWELLETVFPGISKQEE